MVETKFTNQIYIYYIYVVCSAIHNVLALTNVLASRKTHFSYCIRFQQYNFVYVILDARVLSDFQVLSFGTLCTKSKTSTSFLRMFSVTSGVIKTAISWSVSTRFNEECRTIALSAPDAYESFVANVIHTDSETQNTKTKERKNQFITAVLNMIEYGFVMKFMKNQCH